MFSKKCSECNKKLGWLELQVTKLPKHKDKPRKCTNCYLKEMREEARNGQRTESQN